MTPQAPTAPTIRAHQHNVLNLSIACQVDVVAVALLLVRLAGAVRAMEIAAHDLPSQRRAS
jgi:hypothetical protein